MATIKLQPSGAVVIKDGKVACSCCAGGCCPYPAQALVDGLYTYDDLPDDVTVNGTSFPRSGTTYGNTTNGVIFEGNVWAKYTSGVRSSRPCLIQGGVEDQFADTYTVTGPPGGAVVVTRRSLCEWTGSDTCGNEVILEFVSYAQDIYFPYWIIYWLEYSDDCNALELSSGVKEPYAQGGDGINTPVGNYSGNNNGTVS